MMAVSYDRSSYKRNLFGMIRVGTWAEHFFYDIRGRFDTS